MQATIGNTMSGKYIFDVRFAAGLSTVSSSVHCHSHRHHGNHHAR